MRPRVRVLVEGMCNVGLLKGSPDEALRTARTAATTCIAPAIGSGMDVHDVGLYRVGAASRGNSSRGWC